jgi:tetratricopeptide (TPR) repeat protein
MAEEKMYKAALEAIDQGQTARARDLFTRLLKSDSSKADYWLWMSTLVDTAQERIYCLESALRVDPDNEAAKRGLVILGGRPADKDITPKPPIRRHWEKKLEEVVEPSKPLFQRIWGNPQLRLVFILFTILVVGGLIVLLVNQFKPKPVQPVFVYRVSPFPTRTPEPSITPSPTITGLAPTFTPVLKASTPLWAFLSETYTPVPIYVNTPHPIVEAYRAGMRAYEKSDWSSLLSYMLQGVKAEPTVPDFYYYLGEAYRMLGNYTDAVIAYGKAIDDNQMFAPAYLGRALAYEKIDPEADIEGELNYAVNFDPYYVDAFLARARVRIDHKNPQGALDDLAYVDGLFPNNPMVYVLRAQAMLLQNDLIGALQNILKGYELDKTSLPAHYTLALVLLANQDYHLAIQYINIYLVYIHDDGRGFAILSQAEFQLGNYDLALTACTQGTSVDPENGSSWYTCGLIHLLQGDAHTAVNDLVNAVNVDLLNFDYSVALGKALWADGRLNMAVRQLDGAETLAVTDYQRAVVFYNRAMINEEAQSTSDALLDWINLLALPADQVPQDWRTYAQQRYEFYNPPTPTEEPTVTITPSPTPVNMRTATPTPTKTPRRESP